MNAIKNSNRFKICAILAIFICENKQKKIFDKFIDKKPKYNSDDPEEKIAFIKIKNSK